MDFTQDRRKEILRAIEAGKLDSAECEINYDGENITITHVPTNSGFDADYMYSPSNYYSCSSIIGGERASATWASTFSQTAARIRSWARAVVEWRDSLALWEHRHDWEFLHEESYGGTDNSPFTPEEQDAISRQLAAIREVLKKNRDLTAEQEARITARVASID
jgi:hypothetical protein